MCSSDLVTICHDCTPEYHDRMILEGKCQKEQFMPEKQSKTKVYPLNKLKKCNQCGTQDQAEFSPKNFWTCRVCANARKQAWKRSVSNVRTQTETVERSESPLLVDSESACREDSTERPSVLAGIFPYLPQVPLLGYAGHSNA